MMRVPWNERVGDRLSGHDSQTGVLGKGGGKAIDASLQDHRKRAGSRSTHPQRHQPWIGPAVTTGTDLLDFDGWHAGAHADEAAHHFGRGGRTGAAGEEGRRERGGGHHSRFGFCLDRISVGVVGTDFAWCVRSGERSAHRKLARESRSSERPHQQPSNGFLTTAYSTRAMQSIASSNNPLLTSRYYG